MDARAWLKDNIGVWPRSAVGAWIEALAEGDVLVVLGYALGWPDTDTVRLEELRAEWRAL